MLMCFFLYGANIFVTIIVLLLDQLDVIVSSFLVVPMLYSRYPCVQLSISFCRFERVFYSHSNDWIFYAFSTLSQLFLLPHRFLVFLLSFENFL